MGFGVSRLAGLVIVMAAIAIAAPTVHAAPQLKVLRAFCKDVDCGDGQAPGESVVMDQAGNLYGTAQGGAHGEGIIYELTPPAVGGKWGYRVLYHFCAKQNCSDGSQPYETTLMLDTEGNVYGTTAAGGSGNGAGTVFRLSPPIRGKLWTLKTLYNFCAVYSSCKDGQTPRAGLTYSGRDAGLAYDGTSPLYGTTYGGGGKFGGVAYSLTPTSNGKWSEKVLYAFCQTGGKVCTDGVRPEQTLTMDTAGNLYGTAEILDENVTNVVFELSPQIGVKAWSETVLYAPCGHCAAGGLAIDPDGDLFGEAYSGGSGSACKTAGACGFIFEIAAGGAASTVYNFCSQPNCVDGSNPSSAGGLLIDSSGNLFGTTTSGGSAGKGVLYEVSGGVEQVLHTFCTLEKCYDGELPRAGLIMDSRANLYGATYLGGAHISGGAAFELTP
jgi:uncharacterized repeat protein (TIGR03803 family)